MTTSRKILFAEFFVILLWAFNFYLPAIQYNVESFTSDDDYFDKGNQVREIVLPVKDLGENICYYHNYKNTSDPSSSQVYRFLINDDTDKIRYDAKNFSCVNYAIAVHDNAEKNGIKCGIVVLNNRPFYDTGNRIIDKIPNIYAQYGGHAINVFNTTDKGKIYVDCTQHNINQKNNDYIGIINGYYYISPTTLDMEYNNTNSNVMSKIGEIEKIDTYY